LVSVRDEKGHMLIPPGSYVRLASGEMAS